MLRYVNLFFVKVNLFEWFIIFLPLPLLAVTSAAFYLNGNVAFFFYKKMKWIRKATYDTSKMVPHHMILVQLKLFGGRISK